MIQRIKDILNQQLIKNILVVGSVTVLVKIISFYKETVVVSSFGLSELLDTFYLAILLPNFVHTVFMNALKQIFIPNYIAEISEDGNKGEFQAIIFIITFSISTFFSILIYVSVSNFLDVLFPNHTEGYYLLIQKQLYILLPCLFFWGFGSLISGLLDISSKFFSSTISTVFNALSVLFCLFFFKEELGDVVLAVGMLIGSITSLLYVLFVGLWNNLIVLEKPKFSKNSKEMLRQLPPKISSGFLSAMNTFVDQFFAAQLVVGSITALNYGIKIPAFVISILIMALGNVLLPHFSRLIKTDLHKGYHQLFKILKTIFVSSLIIIVISIFFSDGIVSLLFERKEFTSDDTIIVSNIQKIALIYVPFNLCMLVLVRFLTSINKNKFMAWVSLFGLIANIILNSILIKWYEVYGLIMATTIIYILLCIIYMTFTIKQYKLIKSIQ